MEVSLEHLCSSGVVPQLGSTRGAQAGMVLLAVPLQAVSDSSGSKGDRDGCSDILWGCEMQVDVGMPWDSSGKGILPLSPIDGGRSSTVWVGTWDFGWKQGKVHILGGFESCLGRTASLLLFCDCMAPPERLLWPNCILQSTILTVGTQNKNTAPFRS